MERWDKLLENFRTALQCQICCVGISPTSLPLRLPCGHYLCRGCLDRILTAVAEHVRSSTLRTYRNRSRRCHIQRLMGRGTDDDTPAESTRVCPWCRYHFMPGAVFHYGAAHLRESVGRELWDCLMRDVSWEIRQNRAPDVTQGELDSMNTILWNNPSIRWGETLQLDPYWRICSRDVAALTLRNTSLMVPSVLELHAEGEEAVVREVFHGRDTGFGPIWTGFIAVAHIGLLPPGEASPPRLPTPPTMAAFAPLEEDPDDHREAQDRLAAMESASLRDREEFERALALSLETYRAEQEMHREPEIVDISDDEDSGGNLLDALIEDSSSETSPRMVIQRQADGTYLWVLSEESHPAETDSSDDEYVPEAHPRENNGRYPLRGASETELFPIPLTNVLREQRRERRRRRRQPRD